MKPERVLGLTFISLCFFPLSLGRIYYIAPVKISATQPLDHDLGCGGICGKGNLVFVAEALDAVDVIEAARIVRIAEKQHEIYLVIRYPRSDLLCSALIRMHIQRYGKMVAAEEEEKEKAITESVYKDVLKKLKLYE